VIPVRDDRRVVRALAAVRDGCALPPGDVEYIVVNNASPREFGVWLRLNVPPDVQVVDVAKPGPAAARNAGVLAASGEFVLFTDSDAVASPGWVDAALDGFAKTGAAAVRGSNGSLGDSFVQRLIQASSEARGVPQPGRPVRVDTKNLAARREVLLQIPFNERSLRCEDVEWGMVASSAGSPAVYWPAMHVDHEHLERLDEFLARKVCDSWVLRDLLWRRPDLGWRKRPGRAARAVRSAMRRTPGARFAAWTFARATVRGGWLLQRAGPRLPAGVTRRLMTAGRRSAGIAALLLCDTGVAQPVPAQLLWRQQRTWVS